MSLHYPRVAHARPPHPQCSARSAAPFGEPAAPAPAPAGAAPLGVLVDQEARLATAGGRPLDLTFTEFELLAHLVAHPRRVYTRAQLLTAVGGRPPYGDSRTVDVYVARLRRKLGPAYRATIATVRQVGYRFDPAGAATSRG
ncbi:winged helix-turn-helix domain-containing protein [Kitasatospora mediocidica]|uniref:winged helix-turn-helix domain-containing protein n=1 Tax=Kitasatospora mediocidica TaxID=58352 RepID=UPI000690EED0